MPLFPEKDRDSIGMFFDAGGSNFGDATQFFATRTDVWCGELPFGMIVFVPKMAILGDT